MDQGLDFVDCFANYQAWLFSRLMSSIFIARASCKSASSPGRLSGCLGMSFHTNAALLDCDVSEYMLRDASHLSSRRAVAATQRQIMI
jgi:hypothetical protein